MFIAGIDEAGRGPCIGPMVLAVAVVEKKREAELSKIGVKDSKLLTAKERERQFGELQKVLAEFSFTAIDARQIDELRIRKSLNEIEAMRIGMLLNGLKKKPGIVFVDSPDSLQENFAKRLKKYVSFDTIIRTEHRADNRYPIVSAASIIAKVHRDKQIEALAKHYGNIGSGYSHDPITISFLKEFVAKNKCLPPCARKSWLTSQELLDKEFQKKLGDFK